MNIDDRRLRVLRTLLDRPEKTWHVSELAAEANVPQPTTSRIVNELEDEDIIKTRRKGNMKIITLHQKDRVQDIVTAFNTASDRLRDVAEQFANRLKDKDGVEACYLFGSVARGTADEDSDIDILIIRKDDADTVEEQIMVIADTLSENTTARIAPTILTQSTWEQHKQEDSQFANAVEQDTVVLFDKQTS